MNRQEVFNRVYQHLLAQNAYSLGADDGGAVCAYRGAGGLQCAVGCLIKDEHYSWELEGQGAWHPDVLRALDLSLGCSITSADCRMLETLQSMHDNDPVDIWPASLARIAQLRGLTVPEITNAA